MRVERCGVSSGLERLRAEAVEFLAMYANPLFRLPTTFVEMFPMGVLISLLSAALLRNSRFLPARGQPDPSGGRGRRDCP